MRKGLTMEDKFFVSLIAIALLFCGVFGYLDYRNTHFCAAEIQEPQLVNNEEAIDPKWYQMVNFLSDVKAGKEIYHRGFLNNSFAEEIHNMAETRGMKAAWVTVESQDGKWHTLNAFNTTDKGLVYVDFIGTEPFGEWAKIAHIVEGKEYSVIRISYATGNWWERAKEYPAEIKALSIEIKELEETMGELEESLEELGITFIPKSYIYLSDEQLSNSEVAHLVDRYNREVDRYDIKARKRWGLMAELRNLEETGKIVKGIYCEW